VNVFAAVLLASTSLHITVWPAGAGMPGKKEYTLRCTPAAGTLPKPGAACRNLLQLRRPFAPTPRAVACTQIYGGPARALVTGRFRGGLVRARFSRKDGCEIARWDRVRFLFPGAGSASSR
jgi:hypothetical protein